MSTEQHRLYIVKDFAERDHEGKTATEYLIARYGMQGFGFFAGGDIVFFHDIGHRDEFAARFGGVTGHADPNPPHSGREQVSLSEFLRRAS